MTAGTLLIGTRQAAQGDADQAAAVAAAAASGAAARDCLRRLGLLARASLSLVGPLFSGAGLALLGAILAPILARRLVRIRRRRLWLR